MSRPSLLLLPLVLFLFGAAPKPTPLPPEMVAAWKQAGGTVSWAVWKNGDGTWAGMQEMYNTVRNAGFTNPTWTSYALGTAGLYRATKP